MAPEHIRIATRSSTLALTQARWVAGRIREFRPGIAIEFVEVSTVGDRDRVTPIASLSEVGAFVRAVQRAVLEGEADIAVHSCKDLPLTGPEGLTAVYPEREVPWDVLCGSTLSDLPVGARVGTSSPRRSAQLRLLRRDLAVTDVRGNVDTRLTKVESGELAAVVLAEAGLRRLDRTESIHHRFDLDQMVPAPAQAALAVEAVADSDVALLIHALDHTPTRRAVEAERAVLAITGAGCRSALGALATVSNEAITITGFVEDDRGARRGSVTAADDHTAVTALIEDLGLA